MWNVYDIIGPRRRRRTQFHRTTDSTHSSHMLQFHFWNVNNTNSADSVASSRCRLDKSDVRSHVRRYFIIIGSMAWHSEWVDVERWNGFWCATAENKIEILFIWSSVLDGIKGNEFRQSIRPQSISFPHLHSETQNSVTAKVVSLNYFPLKKNYENNSESRIFLTFSLDWVRWSSCLCSASRESNGIGTINWFV